MSFTTAFQANAFQNNAFQIAATTAVDVVGSRISGSTFSRKRWREFLEAQAAQERLALEAMEAATRAADAVTRAAAAKRAAALQRAAKISELALNTALRHADVKIEALVGAINSATRAGSVAAQIDAANRVTRISRIMIEQEEDEDESFFLILSSL